MSEDLTQELPTSPDAALSQILGAVQNLSGRMESLEKKVEDRLYDTRPIWEKVLVDITQLQEGQQRLEEGQQRLEEGQHRLEEGQQRFEEKLETLRDETRTGMRNLKRQFGILNDTFLEVRADYKDLDKRVYELEEPQT